VIDGPDAVARTPDFSWTPLAAKTKLLARRLRQGGRGHDHPAHPRSGVDHPKIAELTVAAVPRTGSLDARHIVIQRRRVRTAASDPNSRPVSA
jgi:hypothetical protein